MNFHRAQGSEMGTSVLVRREKTINVGIVDSLVLIYLLYATNDEDGQTPKEAGVDICLGIYFSPPPRCASRGWNAPGPGRPWLSTDR